MTSQSVFVPNNIRNNFNDTFSATSDAPVFFKSHNESGTKIMNDIHQLLNECSQSNQSGGNNSNNPMYEIDRLISECDKPVQLGGKHTIGSLSECKKSVHHNTLDDINKLISECDKPIHYGGVNEDIITPLPEQNDGIPEPDEIPSLSEEDEGEIAVGGTKKHRKSSKLSKKGSKKSSKRSKKGSKKSVKGGSRKKRHSRKLSRDLPQKMIDIQKLRKILASEYPDLKNNATMIKTASELIDDSKDINKAISEAKSNKEKVKKIYANAEKRIAEKRAMKKAKKASN